MFNIISIYQEKTRNSEAEWKIDFLSSYFPIPECFEDSDDLRSVAEPSFSNTGHVRSNSTPKHGRVGRIPIALRVSYDSGGDDDE